MLAGERVEERKPRQDAAHFQVQRPISHVGLEGDLPHDILMRVGRGVVTRAGIQLGTVRRGEVLGQGDCPGAARSAGVLLRSFERHAKVHRLAGVICETELRAAGPGQTHVQVWINDLRDEQISGQRGEACPIRRHQAPRLPGQEFELVLPQVGPKEPEPQRVAVRRDCDVAGYDPQEISLQVAKHRRRLHLRVEPQADPRVLGAELMFVEVAIDRIAERDGAEVRGDSAGHVRVAAHRGEVHEPDWGDINRPDPEPQARRLRGVHARLLAAAWRRRMGCRRDIEIERRRSNRLGRRCQQPAELIDLSLLRRQLRLEQIDLGEVRRRVVSGGWRRLLLRTQAYRGCQQDTRGQGRAKSHHVQSLRFHGFRSRASAGRGFFSYGEPRDRHACTEPHSDGQGSGTGFADVGAQRDRRSAERLSRQG